MRNFYGDLLCECSCVEFERVAFSTPDGLMVVSHVMATCTSCSLILWTETDPHVEDLEPHASWTSPRAQPDLLT